MDAQIISERILEHVGHSPSPLTAKQICDAVDGEPKSVYPVLKKLRDTGELKGSFQPSSTLIQYARPKPGEEVSTGPVVPLSRRKHNGRRRNGKEEPLDIKTELLAVIEGMCDGNTALLRLVMLYGRV
jgi:hypothetical protein